MALIGCAHIHTQGLVKRLQKRDDITVNYVWAHDVVISSETNLHEQLVLPATAAHKHLFVEKPLGMGTADAYRMANAIKEAGILFQTSYFMGGQPIHLFLREQIQQGNFGTITCIRHSNCHSGSLGGWFDSQWRWMEAFYTAADRQTWVEPYRKEDKI